jgi:NADH-quinone oxidoreductase subunit B
MFNNYAIVQGVDQIVPVDVYAPGCPPGPETLIHSIVTLHTKIQSGEILRRRQETGAGAGITIEAPTPDRAAVRPGPRPLTPTGRG